jgi:hypothetical protein
MNVDAVRAGREARDLDIDTNTAAGRVDHGGTDLLPLRIHNVRVAGQR